MKRFRDWRHWLSLAAIVLCLQGCATPDERVAAGRYVVVRAAQADIGELEMTSLAQRGDRVFERLSGFFGRSLPVPVYIEIDPNLAVSRSYADRGAIGFPPRVVARNAVIVAHEMTHLFMPEKVSEALREGIAVYAQDRFGEVAGYPNYGEDLDAVIVRRLRRGVGSGVRTFSEAEAFFRRNRGREPEGRKIPLAAIDQDARRNAYLLAGSFARYLFEVVLESDMGVFKRIYTSGDYEQQTGRSAVEIEAAWRARTGLNALGRNP